MSLVARAEMLAAPIDEPQCHTIGKRVDAALERSIQPAARSHDVAARDCRQTIPGDRVEVAQGSCCRYRV